MYRDTDGQPGFETYYYIQDDLYNVVALTDDTGAVVERYTYGDYGAPTVWIEDDQNPGTWIENETTDNIPVSSVGNPHMFTGRRWDEALALYDYRTRYYNPYLGRFLRKDTIGLWGDPNNLGNPYAYCGNNPWTHLDPYGEYSWGEFYDEHLSPDALKFKAKIVGGTVVGGVKVIFVHVPVTAGTLVTGAINAYTGCELYSGSEEGYNRIGEALYAFGTHPIDTTKNAYARAVDSAANAIYEGDGYALGKQVGRTTSQGVIFGEVVANPLARLAARAPGPVGTAGTALNQTVAKFPTIESMAGSAFAKVAARLSPGSQAVAETSGTVRIGSGPPVSGGQWYECFAGRHGAGNVEWVSRVPKYAGGKVQGVLETPAGEIHLISGYGGPSKGMPTGAVPGMNGVLKAHVEGHVACVLRQLEVNEGILYMSKVPCTSGSYGGCEAMLPRMLGPGRVLRVVVPGQLDKTYTGVAKP